MNQLLYYDWLSKFYIAGSRTYLNTNKQTTQIWEAGSEYITNNKYNKRVSDKPTICNIIISKIITITKNIFNNSCQIIDTNVSI